MNILPNIKIIDLALWLEKEQALIISDLHLGYEEMLEKRGILTPKVQLKDIIERLNNILKNIKPKTIIINGDLKHEFGNILNQEWRDTLRLFNFLEKHCEEIIIVKGNHDLFLGPLAKRNNIQLLKHIEMNDILIAHGDELIDKGKTIIIGHDHPAITLTDNNKKEKFKCFLKGKWNKKNLIVMPSFHTLTTGMDSKLGSFLTPYIKDTKNFDVYIKELHFGKVKNL
ncbi:MAG: phosphoesterase [Nanoarchaeota archaeon]|nr:phosphoesterase [Nanoarchaeota archaeon]HIJ11351.1 metallophosphoesterase [Candidatus Woesearchaeota archaeon]|tara:strand:+ start:92 stop:772 length:681 start_codon:yes stop_codon:yes gene_type:complete